MRLDRRAGVPQPAVGRERSKPQAIGNGLGSFDRAGAATTATVAPFLERPAEGVEVADSRLAIKVKAAEVGYSIWPSCFRSSRS